MSETASAEVRDDFARFGEGVKRMLGSWSYAEIKRLRFYERREGKLTIETLLKSVVRVADFGFPCRIMVIAMFAEFIDQVTHGMERMTKYREQYRRSDKE